MLEQPKVHYSDLANRYQSFDDIVNDPQADVLAYAMNMEKADFMNLMVKQLGSQKAILEQQVVIRIDGEDVPLKDSTGEPLTYAKLGVIGRSGPDFSGHFKGSAGVANQYLPPQDSATQLTKIDAHIARTKSYAVENGLPIPDEEALRTATSIFKEPMPTQRKLGDFDLKLAEYGTLSAAISDAYREKTGTEIPGYMQSEIAQTAWKFGGEIKSEHVAAATQSNGTVSYTKRVQQDIAQQDSPYHMLLEGPGKKLKEMGFSVSTKQKQVGEIKTHYGIAVVFDAPEIRVMEDGTALRTTDIYQQYAEGKISEEKARQYLGNTGFENKGLFELSDAIVDDGVRLLPQSIVKSNPGFARQADLFAETGAKEALANAQNEEGKTHKLIKTASDIGPVLKGVDEAAKAGDPDAGALQQTAKFSYLMKSIFWGANTQNLNTLGNNLSNIGGDATNNVTKAEYQTMLNSLTYGRQDSPDSIRNDLNWEKIGDVETGKRMRDYEEGVAPLVEFAQNNQAYYAKTEALSQRMSEYEAAIEHYTANQNKENYIALKRAEGSYHEAYQGVHSELNSILEMQAPELKAKLEAGGPQAVHQFLNNATSQTVSGIFFNQTRLELQVERQQERSEQIEEAREQAEHETGEARTVPGTSGERVARMMKPNQVAMACLVGAKQAQRAAAAVEGMNLGAVEVEDTRSCDGGTLAPREKSDKGIV